MTFTFSLGELFTLPLGFLLRSDDEDELEDDEKTADDELADDDDLEEDEAAEEEEGL